MSSVRNPHALLAKFVADADNRHDWQAVRANHWGLCPAINRMWVDGRHRGLLSTGHVAVGIGLSVAAVLFVLCILLLDSLTVQVSRNEIRLRFGIGLFTKNVIVDEVQTSEILRTRNRKGGPIKGGIAYKVGGFDVVELRLSNGRKVQIGTDEPDKLLAAIQSVTAHAD